MGEDYIDYTLLKKKGLLKIKEDNFKRGLKIEDGFIDLASLKSEVADEATTPAQVSNAGVTADTSNFSFLGDMASIGSSTANSVTSPSSGESQKFDEDSLNALKIKIDDIEYKIDKFIERLDRLEDSLNKTS
ncbi:hypothetical protein J4229_01325 [Candidatus Pacearchaeota archaeon]|nr:hypothetical protein [Candidatus Pacearchaeota archaeon]